VLKLTVISKFLIDENGNKENMFSDRGHPEAKVGIILVHGLNGDP
jgi:hypothetical protein